MYLALSSDDLWTHLIEFHFMAFTIGSCLAVFFATLYFLTRPKRVYLVDLSCYKPPPELMVNREMLVAKVAGFGSVTKESLAFQEKILLRSGLGPKTYMPEGNPCMAQARKEAEMVMFGALDELLGKTKVKAEDIGILVVNCCTFSPNPSLSSMLVNRYKLRRNILSYNLGGMGCSASLASIDLAKQLLQVNPNSYALIVSTESITLNMYNGNDRSMLVTDCLFRMGGAAILLSNRSSDRRRSKYQLIHTVRTHTGADDKCYNCIFQQEDATNRVGVSLSKDLMAVVGDALKTNITTLGSLVLPMSERIARKVFKAKKIKSDLKMAFEHLCVHAGGKAVLDEVKRNLHLSDWDLEPSRMTLYRFGNTSSSTTWYELAYSEAKGRVKKGDRVCQVAFGSGFKCNSAVWRALRTVRPSEEKNPWTDEIDEFPVDVRNL